MGSSFLGQQRSMRWVLEQCGNRIIGHLHPASLKDDWDEKRKGLDRLADRVFDYLRDQMPKNTTEALQDQVEQLLKENEKLKAATGHPPSPVESPTDPETPADRERLRIDKSKPRVTPPAPPRSGLARGSGEVYFDPCCSC